MALFTDGPISCIEDLTAQDSQLLSVASVEGIDTTQKSAIAQEEVAMDLIAALRRVGCAGHLFWLAPQFKLDNVVVTPPLKLWHTARALELFYQDAYNNQLNDRYAGKRNQFHDMAKWAFGKLIEIGVGIAGTPVPSAAIPVLAPFTGALPDGVYYVTMAWVNRIAEEGAPATASTIATASSTFLVEPVNAGPVDAEPVSAPENAAGWNVYAGVSPDAMFRQNASLLSVGQAWEQPATLVQEGSLPGKGQKPTYLQPLPRILQRG
jgi:hypothetical protein